MFWLYFRKMQWITTPNSHCNLIGSVLILLHENNWDHRLQFSSKETIFILEWRIRSFELCRCKHFKTNIFYHVANFSWVGPILFEMRTNIIWDTLIFVRQVFSDVACQLHIGVYHIDVRLMPTEKCQHLTVWSQAYP